MFDLKHMCSQYELLELLAQSMSTKDLYNTALTCSELYALILKTAKVFERLKRVALYDGSGLKARIAHDDRCTWYEAKEIEVRLWNTKCDETGGLPCLKCGVNVCEECRVYPRVGDSAYGPCRRPHFTTTYEMQNIICYCDACDKAIENGSREDVCACDRYTRWICSRCCKREEDEAGWYLIHRTKHYSGWGTEAYPDMVLPDHQHERLYWCPCGTRAPAMGNIRCIWCKKKHKTSVVPRTEHEPERRMLDFSDQEGFSHPFEADRRLR